MASLSSDVAELSKVFAGSLIEPGAPSYETVRRLHNGAIDKRPALLASCRGTADIADAIRLARAQGLEIAVRGGGHNVAGRGSVDGGVMIDLSLIRHATGRPDDARGLGRGRCIVARVQPSDPPPGSLLGIARRRGKLRRGRRP